MTDGATIVLCGGPVNYTQIPVGGSSNGMVPVNGKPVIAWILDDLIAKGISDVVVVAREDDRRLQDFVKRAYDARMSVTIAPVSGGSIVDSLQAGLNAGAPGIARVILGDTLIRDPYDGTDDFVYVGHVEDSRRWCLVEPDADGVARAYQDKRALPIGDHLALAGYYHFGDGDLLRGCVDAALAARERELSDVLRRYGMTRPIATREVRDWLDFGHIDNLVDARRRLLRSRYFNALKVHPILNTVTKISEDVQKLRDEVDWYAELPEELRVLAPRIVRAEEAGGRLEVVQEYYGYPTLAELYLYAGLDADSWYAILRRILATHREFLRYEGEGDVAADAHDMYAAKTRRRLEEARAAGPELAELLDAGEIWLNGERLAGIPAVMPHVEALSERLSASARSAIVHGDFCFSNILFDPAAQIIRLIDPRGRFGRKGIYGDPRYDIAKLRHSVSGLYDYIVADQFELRSTGSEFEARIFSDPVVESVRETFDQMIADDGYDLAEIRAIEAMLFLSMLPLHHGHPERQRMMLLTGLSILDDIVR